MVYHYCNLDTFLKIIQNKSLRLSDIGKSNDYTELTYMENMIRKEFEKKIMTIQNFNMTPYSIEINLKKISNKINMIKSEINNFLMNGGYKQGLLQELIYGNDNYGIELGVCLR